MAAHSGLIAATPGGGKVGLAFEISMLHEESTDTAASVIVSAMLQLLFCSLISWPKE